MKVGILTVPFNNNYGGFLQAFALKQVLMAQGHEVAFINRRRNKKFVPLFKRVCLFPYLLYKEKRQQRIQNRLNQYTSSFKEKYLSPISEEYYTTLQLAKGSMVYHFDAVVVGSDQVWRYRYAKDSIDDFYCNFLEGTGVKHIAYAASFGTDEQEYPTEKLSICAKLIQTFSAISVRESSGKNLLTNYFGIPEEKVQVVLDPTFLLPVSTYQKLFEELSAPTEKYVFTYILDKNANTHQLIESICSEKAAVEYSISAQTGKIDTSKPIEPIEQWLMRLYYADFVVTDSFHGTVFSILFNKPFIVCGNKVRGISRIKSLLDTFGLEKQYVDMDEVIIGNVTTNINWAEVNNIIAQKRETSMVYLMQSLTC